MRSGSTCSQRLLMAPTAPPLPLGALFWPPLPPAVTFGTFWPPFCSFFTGTTVQATGRANFVFLLVVCFSFGSTLTTAPGACRAAVKTTGAANAAAGGGVGATAKSALSQFKSGVVQLGPAHLAERSTCHQCCDLFWFGIVPQRGVSFNSIRLEIVEDLVGFADVGQDKTVQKTRCVSLY